MIVGIGDIERAARIAQTARLVESRQSGRAILHASEVMLGKPVETYYSPSAFDQGYLNHVGIATANFGAGEHQYAHTDYDMASVERTTDSARVYAFMMLDYLG